MNVVEKHCGVHCVFVWMLMGAQLMAALLQGMLSTVITSVLSYLSGITFFDIANI